MTHEPPSTEFCENQLNSFFSSIKLTNADENNLLGEVSMNCFIRDRKWIYIAPLLKYLTLKALRYRSHSVTCKLHRTCLYLVSIHQMAHPQTEVVDI